jgi:hypothetical protein
VSLMGVFDAFLRFSDYTNAVDAWEQRVRNLRSRCARECGNCDHWMKSRICPIDDQRRGFPSMSYPGCGKFTPKRDAVMSAEELARIVKAPPRREDYVKTQDVAP